MKSNAPLIRRKQDVTVPGLVFSDKAIFILSQTASSEGLAHPLVCRIRVEVTFVWDEYARCLPAVVVRIGPIFAKMLSFITVLLTRYVITRSLMSVYHFTPWCSLQLNFVIVLTTKQLTKEDTFKILEIRIRIITKVQENQDKPKHRQRTIFWPKLKILIYSIKLYIPQRKHRRIMNY